MGKICRRFEIFAYLDKQMIPPRPNSKFRQSSDLRTNSEIQHEMTDNRHVKIDESIITGFKEVFYKLTMIDEIWRIRISMMKTLHVFSGPATCTTNSHIVYLLQTESFFPYRNRHPQRTLVVFEAIAGDPGCALGKLNTIEDDKYITPIGLVEEAGKRSKIRPVGGNNHFSARCRPTLDVTERAEMFFVRTTLVLRQEYHI